MSRSGYSIVEVLLAAAVVAVGMTAGAILVGAILAQQQVSATAMLAANLQEQAVTLHRLGLEPAEIRAVLPEDCVDSDSPPAGALGLVFTDNGVATENVTSTNGIVVPILLDSADCRVVFDDGEESGVYYDETVRVLRPTIRDLGD